MYLVKWHKHRGLNTDLYSQPSSSLSTSLLSLNDIEDVQTPAGGYVYDRGARLASIKGTQSSNPTFHRVSDLASISIVA